MSNPFNAQNPQGPQHKIFFFSLLYLRKKKKRQETYMEISKKNERITFKFQKMLSDFLSFEIKIKKERKKERISEIPNLRFSTHCVPLQTRSPSNAVSAAVFLANPFGCFVSLISRLTRNKS